MVNLHESMGPDRDRTRDPWICRQEVNLFISTCIIIVLPLKTLTHISENINKVVLLLYFVYKTEIHSQVDLMTVKQQHNTLIYEPAHEILVIIAYA